MARDEMRAPEGAEHGTGASLRRLAGTVQQPRQSQPVAPQPAQGRPAPVAVRGPAAELEDDEDLSGGYDEALFAPTDRADEPLTDGVPFGPGRNFVILPYESERAFQLRVADVLEQSSEAPSLRSYIDKLRAGG